jgi:hypothetical protein
MRVFRPPRHYAFASRVRASGHTEGTSPERKRGTAPNSAHDLHASIRTQRATCGHLPRRLIGIRPLTRRPQHPSLKELSPGQFFPRTSYLTIFLFVVTLNPGRTARDCVNCGSRRPHLQPGALGSRAKLSHNDAGSGRAPTGPDAPRAARAARSCHRPRRNLVFAEFCPWKVETPISNQHCSFCSKLQFTTGLLPENPPTVFVWISRFAFPGPEKF